MNAWLDAIYSPVTSTCPPRDTKPLRYSSSSRVGMAVTGKPRAKRTIMVPRSPTQVKGEQLYAGSTFCLASSEVSQTTSTQLDYLDPKKQSFSFKPCPFLDLPGGQVLDLLRPVCGGTDISSYSASDGREDGKASCWRCPNNHGVGRLSQVVGKQVETWPTQVQKAKKSAQKTFMHLLPTG